MQDAVIKEYSRLAGEYDSRWKFYTEATARKTLSVITLKSQDRVLDIGCGTGILLHYLSESYPGIQLSGIDPVKEMLAVARQRLPSSADLREGWAEYLPFSDHHFDVVFCCSMFHYIGDPATALHEIRRVLRPGGMLIMTDWCKDYLTIRISEFFLKTFDKAYCHSYRSGDIINLLQKSNFTILKWERYKINTWWGMMTIKVSPVAH